MKQVAGKVQCSQVGRRLRYVQCNVTLEIFKKDKGGMFFTKMDEFSENFQREVGGGGGLFSI